MKIDNVKITKILLILGAVYFLIAAIAHFFGLTIFPFYIKELRVPYHDILIALASLIIAIFLLAISKDPVRNINTLNAAIMGGIIGIVFGPYIIWKIDFVQLGAPAKVTQTIVETIVLTVFVILFLIFKPKKIKRG